MCPALAEGSNHIRICASIETVAKVGSIDHPWEQTVSDAKLIAAAPDLLEALQELRAIMDAFMFSEDDVPAWTYRKAIKKATEAINKATE